MGAVVNHLRALGLNSMITWAFADNPYASFYKNLGGAIVDEKMTEVGGKLLKEIAFGCYDLLSFDIKSITANHVSEREE
ncbi:MAG: hypothetical protein Q6370_015805 [Candidatus Sigynarchaeota archaeon]